MKNVHSIQEVSIKRSLCKKTPQGRGNERRMKQTQIQRKIPSALAAVSGVTSPEILTQHNRRIKIGACWEIIINNVSGNTNFVFRYGNIMF